MSSMISIVRRALSAARRALLEGAFLVFDRVLPVREDFWCFCTWKEYGHTLDNPRAVFEEVKDDASLHKIVLQKDASPEPVHEGTRVTFVAAESLRGAYYLARSRVVLVGYVVFGLSSYSKRLDATRHEIIQLWHGIPLKRIGHLFPGEDFWDGETGRYAATVCSSERDQEIMSQAFAPLPSEHVWLTGLPRNSLLLKEEERLPADYRQHLEWLDQKVDGRRLVLYAPTWRENIESHYAFSSDELADLDRLLSKHEAVIGIRGHPNVRAAVAFATASGPDRIFSVNELPDPSVLLRRAAVLITDYSSIYIDFLLTDRPILHFTYDLEAYKRERGFLYDPQHAFGGPSVGSFDALLARLDEVLADPTCFDQRRREARQLFHGHDRDSAREVVRRVRSLVVAGNRADRPVAERGSRESGVVPSRQGARG